MKNNNLLVLVGQNIRKIRSKFNISQEELADKAGLDRTYVGGIERGERNVSLLSLEKISIALNVKISELFAEEE